MRWLLDCRPKAASGPTGRPAMGQGGGWGHFTVSPYQFLRAEADEDPLSVFAVVSALHQGQEELGGIVLATRSHC